MQLHTLTLTQAHRLLAAKEISSVELTRAVLDRITAVDATVHAYISVTADEALAAAEAADRAIAEGRIGRGQGFIGGDRYVHAPWRPLRRCGPAPPG
ncbi:MAG: amidase family protein [Desulfobacteraceae bacterium]